MKLAIDMQKCFVAEFPDARTVGIAAEVINYVATMLRDAGHTIIQVKDVEGRGERSEEELDFVVEIERLGGDLELEKIYSNAFWQTDLQAILHKQGVDLVIACGQAAGHCVLFTYNGAIERGFRSVVLQGGVAGGNRQRVKALYEDRNVISYPSGRQPHSNEFGV